MSNASKPYLRLFVSAFALSAFTFGGGFVMIPLMRQRFVDKLKWLSEQEMLDITAIAQASPGAIAVNAAILVGYRVAGVVGALLTVLGTVLPPLIVLSVISLFYAAFRDNRVVGMAMKGMQAGVAAVICDVVLSMGKGVLDLHRALVTSIMMVSFLAVAVLHVNVVWVILFCGVIGALDTLISSRRRKLES